ncbi:MAG: phage holin family protein [Actinobacteria bacterium]|nr:phage holin family protein [Actinomycetota bacterium]
MRVVRSVFARLFTNVIAVLAVVQFVPNGIMFPPTATREFWVAVTAFAAVLALANACVRPVVDCILTPISCVLGVLTLGLSHLALNVAVFGGAAALVPGVRIESPGAALLGALIVSVVGSAGSVLLGGRR